MASGATPLPAALRTRFRPTAGIPGCRTVRRPALFLGLALLCAFGLGLALSDGSMRNLGYQGALTEMISPLPPTVADIREELDCLARNVYFEARGEPDEGKAAVAHVVMNRAASGRFPDTVCDVVRQGGERKLHKCQFSWWCDGRSDQPTNQRAWLDSKDVAHKVFWGRSDDPTAGALWYHAAKAKPIWRKALMRGPQIGDHIFYVAPMGRTQVASRAGDAAD